MRNLFGNEQFVFGCEQPVQGNEKGTRYYGKLFKKNQIPSFEGMNNVEGS